MCKSFLPLFIFFLTRMFFLSADAWDKHVEVTLKKLEQYPGWCNKEKAEVLMNFIHEKRPLLCVEIGAFGGSTTYPLVSSLHFNKKGVLYAIDAWDSKVATEGLNPDDPNAVWWGSLDMNSIYRRFKNSFKHLGKFCQCIKKKSEEAVAIFSDESIDFLYIDGGFSSKCSLQDALLYFPKVKVGGYIWINDASLEAKSEAVVFLMENACWLKERSIKNSCIVFQKSKLVFLDVRGGV